MALAWSYPERTSAHAVIAGDRASIVVAPQGGERLDLVDARTGTARVLRRIARASWVRLLDTGGPDALALTQDGLELLGADAAPRWSVARPTSGIAAAAHTTAGVVVVGLGHVQSYTAAGAPSWKREVTGVDHARGVGDAVLVWGSGPPRWRLLDAATGAERAGGAQGIGGGGAVSAQGARFAYCTDVRATVYDAKGGEVASAALPAPCGDLAFDDDTFYAAHVRTAALDAPGDVRAIGFDGRERWHWSGPLAHGPVVHGPWLLVPSEGGVVRALRRKDGALAWSWGVGSRPALRVAGDVVVAETLERVHALGRTQGLEAERASDVTVHVRAWRCVDASRTTLVVGDVVAQGAGDDRFVARVSGRGSVAVRASPWADIVLVGHDAFGPVAVDVDGRPHALEVELDACDED